MDRSPSKRVTAAEIRSGRFYVTAAMRNLLFRHLPDNTKTDVNMVDEKGDSHHLQVKLRDNRKKSEFLARGGKKFARKRNLRQSDVLVFSLGQSPDHFRVRVEKARRSPAPAALIEAPAVEALVLFGPLSAPSSPRIGHGAVGLGLGLGLSIHSADHSPVESPVTATESELGFIHSPTKPETGLLGLGLAIGSHLHPLTTPNQKELSTAMAMAMSSMKAEKQGVDLNLELMSTGMAMAMAELNLDLTLGSPWASLQDQSAVKLSASEALKQQPQYLAAEKELQKPKPSTELVLAPPAADF